jgi:WD40 repeat protein
MSKEQWVHVSELAYLPDPEYQTEAHTKTIYMLSSTPSYIISSGKDQSIRIWSKETHRLAFPPLLGHPSSVVAIEVSDAEGSIFSGDGKGNIMIWGLNSGTLVQNIEQAHSDTVLGIAFNGGSLVTASRDGSVKVWGLEPALDSDSIASRFSIRHTLLGHQGAVLSVRVTKDGRRAVAMSGGDRAMKIWDTQSGQLIKSFEALPGVAPKFQLIDGESKVLAACTDYAIRVFDVETGDEEVCLYGHGNCVKSVKMVGNSEETRMIVSASYDGTVRLWTRSDAQVGWSTVRILNLREVVGNDIIQIDDAKRVHDIAVDEMEGFIYACGEAREIVRWKLHSTTGI